MHKQIPFQDTRRQTRPPASFATLLRRARGEERLLVDNNHTSDTGGRKRGQDTGKQRTDGDAGNITRAAGRELRKHTDLVTQRTDVTETAERVGGNEAGTVGERLVQGVGGKIRVGDKLVGNDLDTNETADVEEIPAVVFAADSQQERDRVENVAEDEFQGQVVVAVEVNVYSNQDLSFSFAGKRDLDLQRPHQVSRPSIRAIKATMQSKLARIMPAILRPSQAPLAKA